MASKCTPAVKERGYNSRAMPSYTVVIQFVCKDCLKPNTQRKRFDTTDKESAMSQASSTKVFCDNPDCREQAYDVLIYGRHVFASTPDEVASIPLESPSGLA
jgi:hypothetical protein